MKDKKYDVIVIGGGASGLMAAGRAASRGKKVLLLEKNKDLGKKLKITGGGRCNITNAEESEKLLLSNYGRAEQFLYSAFDQFGMPDTFKFFEGKNLPIVVQARKRAFPKSEKALDVFKVLEKYIKQGNVEIKTGSKVTGIISDNKNITKVVVGKQEFRAKSFIVATGSLSHPETGSTGDGFKWLEDLGHEIDDPTPAIVPLAVEDQWVKDLAGVSLSSMRITFLVDGKKKLALKGKILFTHFGFSGPLILNAAKKVADLLHEGEVTVLIDAYVDIDHKQLDKKITKVFDDNKNRDLKNIFKAIVPKGMSEAILSMLTKTTGDTKVHSVSKEARKELVHLLKAMPATIEGLMGDDRAVISDGGVLLKEVDAKTMQSKHFDNLYIIGDLLNINRPSGGYSLQLCWTTGFVAGSQV